MKAGQILGVARIVCTMRGGSSKRSLVAAVQNFLIQELPTALVPPGRARLIKDQIEKPEDGYLEIPNGIGWGVELDEEFVRANPWDPGSPREPWSPLGPDGGLVHT